MKWRVYKNDHDESEGDKNFPISLNLSYEGSSALQLDEMTIGNFINARSAIAFIREVKRAPIKREIDFPEKEVER